MPVCRFFRVPLLLVAALLPLGVCAQGPNPALPRVRLEFFYEPGCDECRRVREEVLPQLEASHGGLYELVEREVSAPGNHERLVALMLRFGAVENARVFMLVGDRVLLAGGDRIAAGLSAAVDEAVAEGLAATAASAGSTTGTVSAAKAPITTDREGMRDFARRFRLPTVLLAGLVDGINPCAIATLVFLVSVLSVSGRAGATLPAVGAVFCAASFLTYTAIGFGLLGALHRLAAFRRVQSAVDLALIGLLVVLAALSFLDAFRFRRSGRAADVTVQLPARVKNLVHRVLRLRVGGGAGLVSVFLAGAAVTALESVCTGQVYAPTLAFLVKSHTDALRSLFYLLAYNTMFILPLVVILILMHRGLKLARLMAWSGREVFVGKLLMGLFFAALAAVMFALR